MSHQGIIQILNVAIIFSQNLLGRGGGTFARFSCWLLNNYSLIYLTHTELMMFYSLTDLPDSRHPYEDLLTDLLETHKPHEGLLVDLSDSHRPHEG